MKHSDTRILSLGLRFTLYIALQFVMFFWLTYAFLPRWDWAFSENGPIEWMQFALLASSALTMLIAVLVFAELRRLFCLLLACTLLAMARELDKILDAVLPIFGWQIIFFLVIPLIAFQFIGNRQALFAQLRAFTFSPAMAVFWVAIVVIIPLAQCLGDAGFLKAATGGEYMHMYKNLFEESLELYGYLLLFCGSIESIVFALSYRRHANIQAEN